MKGRGLIVPYMGNGAWLKWDLMGKGWGLTWPCMGKWVGFAHAIYGEKGCGLSRVSWRKD